MSFNWKGRLMFLESTQGSLLLLAEGRSLGPAQCLPTSGRGLASSWFLACPDGQLRLRVQQETQMGRRATKRTFLAQPFRITWDLGIPLALLPAPHLSCHHLLLLSLSLAFNSPFTIFIEAPWLLWKPKAAKEVEFGEVLRFPGQHVLL